ncbi:MAG: hypothetical protein JSW27_06790 [Phycisphaerales bacterium]|nr:MAG: hypothetical protein JSW27_06790 [Phycisphaerales bacterium]
MVGNADPTTLARLLLAAELGIVVDLPADLMTEIPDTAIELIQDDYASELAATITHIRDGLEAQGVTGPCL